MNLASSPPKKKKEWAENTASVSKGQTPIGLMSKGLESPGVQGQHQLFSLI